MVLGRADERAAAPRRCSPPPRSWLQDAAADAVARLEHDDRLARRARSRAPRSARRARRRRRRRPPCGSCAGAPSCAWPPRRRRDRAAAGAGGDARRRAGAGGSERRSSMGRTREGTIAPHDSRRSSLEAERARGRRRVPARSPPTGLVRETSGNVSVAQRRSRRDHADRRARWPSSTPTTSSSIDLDGEPGRRRARADVGARPAPRRLPPLRRRRRRAHARAGRHRAGCVLDELPCVHYEMLAARRHRARRAVRDVRHARARRARCSMRSRAGPPR